MFDKDTLIVAYDDTRGEPRGSRPKRIAHAELASQGKGDCIDCGLCVQVCPTGIDIRKGLQYECIGCAACADVCDEVMDKMSYPRGLVRYVTQSAQKERWTKAQMWRRVARPRVLIYSAILLLVAVAFVVSLALRKPFRVDVVRDRGSLARIVDRGAIENTYRLQVMNATETEQQYGVTVSGIDGAALDGGVEIKVGAAESRWVPVNVRVPADVARRLGGGAHPIRFEITSTERPDAHLVEPSTFVVPR